MDPSLRTIEDQINYLKGKGMLFPDKEAAVEFLSRVSFFRLKYYWKDLLSEDGETFHDNVNFTEIMQRYSFEHDFRLVLFDGIENIEIALRARIINIMAQTTNYASWYLDESLFEDSQRHEDFVLDLKYEFDRSAEPFVINFLFEHDNWDSESLEGDNPEAWHIIEVATFGTLSKMYKNLKSQLPQRSTLANGFGLYSSKDFSNWIEIISLIRNIVAHHARLWNRNLSKKISDPKGHRDPWLINGLKEFQKMKPYGVTCAIAYLCKAVNNSQKFVSALKDLEAKYHNNYFYKFGFSKDWKTEPLWRY